LKKLHVSLVLFLVLGFLVFSMSIAVAKDWPGRETRTMGVAVKTFFPYAEYGDETDTGYGIAWIYDYPLIPLIDLTADVGYSHFSTPEGSESVNIWNFTFGGRLVLGPFFMGGETGYYTKVEEWSYVPSMGLRFGAFEGALSYKSVGTAAWTQLRFGYYF